MSIAGCISHATVFHLTDVYVVITPLRQKAHRLGAGDMAPMTPAFPTWHFFLASAAERTGTRIAYSG
jgi:hypothetical protein